MNFPTTGSPRSAGPLLPLRLRKPLLVLIVLGGLVVVSARLCKVDLAEFGPGLAKGVEVLRFFDDGSTLTPFIVPTRAQAAAIANSLLT